MKRTQTIAVSALALAVSGCGTFELEELRKTTPTGQPFTQALSREYLAFSESEAAQYDWPDAWHFAGKGLAAARGTAVEPEQPANWDIDNAGVLKEVSEARARLMRALDAQARTKAPAVSATAQVKYDCWLEQAEEGWQEAHIDACRKDFYTAIEAMEAALKAPVQAPPKTVDPVKPPAPPELQVFFDFASAHLTDAAFNIVKEAARIAKDKGWPTIVVSGHTDRAGSDATNQRLSLKRADAVRKALVAVGVPADKIEVVGKGETELLIPTEDGIRNAQNRRSVIQFK